MTKISDDAKGSKTCGAGVHGKAPYDSGVMFADTLAHEVH